MRVLISKDYGGLWVTKSDLLKYVKAKGWVPLPDETSLNHLRVLDKDPVSGEEGDINCHLTGICRHDPDLIAILEGQHGTKVVEIPDGVEYEIYDWDGVEQIHEVHRVWH